jgi:hypothetical protein
MYYSLLMVRKCYLETLNNNQMSVPAAVAAVAPAAIAAMNPLDALMATVNTNPYFIGLMMLLLNLGGRFLALEISKDQEKFLSQPLVRRFFLFAILFVATRNVVIAAGLAIIVILLLGYLFNENSELCLWKSCIIAPAAPTAKQEGFMGLTPEEALILKRLQDKQNAAAQQQQEAPVSNPTPMSTASNIYKNAVQQLSKLTSTV